MEIEWIVFISILVTNGLAAAFIAVMLSRRPHEPDLHSLMYMLAALSIWSFAYAMITILPPMNEKLFWLKVENIGIVTVPVFWFFFTAKYTRLDRWLTRKPIMLLFWVIPATSLVMVFSHLWFQLYYPFVKYALEWGGPLIISRGPMYWVQLIQTYALTLTGMGVLIWRFIQSRHTYRRHLLFLVGAVLFPFLFNIIYQLRPDIFPFFMVPIDLACEIIVETRKLVGMDLVEVNPILDIQNQTASLAVEFALSSLGRRVWNG